jgi:hypothetical protein
LKGTTHTIDRLAKSEVTIDGRTCGFLPDNTKAEWYEVKCEKPLIGGNIMVTNGKDQCLHFN